MAQFFLSLTLSLPFLNLIVLIITQRLGANPVEKLLLESGQGALSTLIFLLILAPLAKFFPRQRWLKQWTKRRRTIGLTLWFYASLHLSLYIADHIQALHKLPDDLLKPFVATGVISWLIYMLLGITSNRWSKRRLKSNWKKLHRLVWLSVPLTMVHLTLKEEGEVYRTVLWFSPLFFTQGLQFWALKRQKIRTKQGKPLT